MTLLVNGFESGTNGSNITTGNSGDANDNAFNAVTIGGGGTAAYSNTQVKRGTLSASFATTTANSTDVAWTTSMGTQTQVWFRIYMYFASNPSAETRFFSVSAGGSGFARFAVISTGKVRAEDSAGSTISTTTNSISLNQWVRVEGFVIGSATVGQTEVKLFNSWDSTTPTETNTSAATLNTGGSMTFYAFGPQAGTSNQGPYFADDVGLSNVAYIGPTAEPVSGPDTGTGTETSSITATTSSGDTGSGLEGGSVNTGAQPAGADTGTGTEAGSVNVGAEVASADTGLGDDEATVTVAYHPQIQAAATYRGVAGSGFPGGLTGAASPGGLTGGGG